MSDVKKYKFNVEMSCTGCSTAISNVLNQNREKGIQDFDVNLKEQTVTIHSSNTIQELTEILKKTGKKFSTNEN